MDDSIGVGIIVGLTFASSIYVWNNEKFNRVQKTILLICIIFPPAQWVGILGVLAYNSYKVNNSKEKILERKIEQAKSGLDNSISNLADLKDKGILTDDEYQTKIEKLELEKAEEDLKNSIEYKQLKSLFNLGILTKEEFESKIEILNSRKREKRTDEFRIIDGFSEGLALAINSDLDYGFIDENRDVIISFKFEHAENFIDGVAKVRYNGEFKSIDKKGDFI